MFCAHCGSPNDDRARVCTTCGTNLTDQPGQGGIKIPNYLVQAILVTFCCCLPFGIPAIVFAAQVDGKAASGDIAGARDSSKNAKLWCWIAFALGATINGAYCAFMIFAILAEGLPPR